MIDWLAAILSTTPWPFSVRPMRGSTSAIPGQREWPRTWRRVAWWVVPPLLVTGVGFASWAAGSDLGRVPGEDRVDLDRVALDADRMSTVATTRSQVSAATLAQQATVKALQVYGPSPRGYIQAADEVDQFLRGVSDKSLREQLGAALTSAQNIARLSVLKAAPESAGTAGLYDHDRSLHRILRQ